MLAWFDLDVQEGLDADPMVFARKRREYTSAPVALATWPTPPTGATGGPIARLTVRI